MGIERSYGAKLKPRIVNAADAMSIRQLCFIIEGAFRSAMPIVLADVTVFVVQVFKCNAGS